MNQNPKQLARDITNADLAQGLSGMLLNFQTHLFQYLRLGIGAYQADVNQVCYKRFVNKKPVRIIEVNPAMAGVKQYITKTLREEYINIQGIFYRAAKKNSGKHVEQQIMANEAYGNYQKFINLSSVPSKTLNPLI